MVFFIKRGKNYLNIPQITLEEIKTTKTNYIQLGCVLKASKNDIKNGCYKDLSIEIKNGNVKYIDSILPPTYNGRYSSYNQKGRSIIRRNLPKVTKWFSHDIYPYGDTSRNTVLATYSRKVWQREEWLPEFLTFSVSLKQEDSEFCYFIIKCEEIIDKRSNDAEFRVLYNINLISENCGNYQIIENDKDDDYILKTLYVNWELLPPGHIEIQSITRNFETKSPQEQKEVLERFEYIKSFNPKKLIKGSNKFSQYFGAIMSNDVVVLENTHVGNAIYVFYNDWEILSKLSRTELLRMNSKNVTRIRHSGNWKELLNKTINNKE